MEHVKGSTTSHRQDFRWRDNNKKKIKPKRQRDPYRVTYQDFSGKTMSSHTREEYQNFKLPAKVVPLRKSGGNGVTSVLQPQNGTESYYISHSRSSYLGLSDRNPVKPFRKGANDTRWEYESQYRSSSTSNSHNFSRYSKSTRPAISKEEVMGQKYKRTSLPWDDDSGYNQDRLSSTQSNFQRWEAARVKPINPRSQGVKLNQNALQYETTGNTHSTSAFQNWTMMKTSKTKGRADRTSSLSTSVPLGSGAFESKGIVDWM